MFEALRARGPFLALAVCLPLAVVGPLLWGRGVDQPDDAAWFALPAWAWLQTAFEEGHDPFWVVGKLGGVSLFADVVPMGPFYPAAALALALPPIPALGLASLLHALAIPWVFRAVAQHLGVRGPLSWLPGLALVAGPLGLWFTLDAHYESWATWTWWPLLWMWSEVAAGSRGLPRRRAMALAAGSLMLLLLGSHLRLGGAAVGAYLLWVLLRGRDRMGGFAIAALGLGLGAPGWIPALVEARSRGDTGFFATVLQPPDLALGPSQVAGWSSPSVWGTHPDLGLSVPITLGLLTLLVRRPVDARVVRLAGFGVFLLLAGMDLGPLGLLFAPLHAVSAPVDLVWSALALMPLALAGTAALAELAACPPKERWPVLRPAAGAAVAMIVAGGLRAALGTGDLVGMTHRVYAGAIVVVAAATLVLVVGRKGPEVAGPWMVLAGLELTVFTALTHLAVPSLPLVDPRVAAALAPLEGQLDTIDLSEGYDAALSARHGLRSDDEVREPFRDAPALQRALVGRIFPPHHGVALGRPALGGRAKVPPRPALTLLEPLAERLSGLEHNDAEAALLFADPEGLGQQTLRAFRIPWAFAGSSHRTPAAELAPWCEVATSMSVEPEAAALRWASLRGSFVLESGPPMPVAEGEVLSSDPAVRRARVRLQREGTVVLGIRPHPGWVFSVDGRPTQARAIRTIDSAIVVGAGEHEIVATFQPPGLRPSLLLSALLCLLVGAGCWGSGTPAGRAAEADRQHSGPVGVEGPATGALGRRVPSPGPRRVRRRSALGAKFVLALGWALVGLWFPGTAEAARFDVELQGAVDGVGRSIVLTSTARPFGAGTVEHALIPGVPLSIERPPEADLLILVENPAGAEPVLRRVEARPGSPTTLRLRATPAPALRNWLFHEPVRGAWRAVGATALVVAAFFLFVRRRLKAEGEGALPAAPRRLSVEWLILGAVLLWALGFRLLGLRSEPFDLEERTYMQLGEWTFPHGMPRPPWVVWSHAPLGHLLFGGLAALDLGPAWIRLPSVLASLGQAALVWTIVRRRSRRMAFVAAFALGLSPAAAYYGRTATPYALVGLCALVAIEAAMQLLEGRRWAPWVLCLAIGVGFLFHQTALAFAIGTVAFVFAGAHRLGPGPAQRGARDLCTGLVLGLPILALDATLHGTWFATSAMDARLLADAYPRDPGLGTFLVRVGTVLLSSTVQRPWAAFAAMPLVFLGLVALRRSHAALTALLGTLLLVAFAAAAVLHTRLTFDLDGHIFWGFRWVAWAVPVAVIVGTQALRDEWRPPAFTSFWFELDLWLRWACALIWVWAASRATLDRSDSPHPDYRAAAATILGDLRDGDALAVVPVWAQRDALLPHLREFGGVENEDRPGQLSWGRKRLFTELQNDGRPFELDAGNLWIGRLWLVAAREPMFHEDKFSAARAADAIAWAERHLVPDGRWSVQGIELLRYRSPPPSAEAPEGDLGAPASWRLRLPGHAPCDPLDPQARWDLVIRVPEGWVVEAIDGGQASRLADPLGTALSISGGPCSGPAPQLRWTRLP